MRPLVRISGELLVRSAALLVAFATASAIVARIGEPFKFRISLQLPLASTAPLELRHTDSDSTRLPRFLRIDLVAAASARASW